MSKESYSNSRENCKRNVKKVILQGRNHSYEYEKRFDDKGNNVVVKTIKTIEINRTSKVYRDGSPSYKAKGYERPTKASLLKQVNKSTTKFLNKSDEIFKENQKFFENIEKDISLAINNTVSPKKTNLMNQCNIDKKSDISSLINSQNEQKKNATPSCVKIISFGQTEKESENLNRSEKEYFNMPPNGRIYPTKYKTVPKTFISKNNDQPDSYRLDQTWDQSLSRNKKEYHDRHKSILKKSNITEDHKVKEDTKKIEKATDVKHPHIKPNSNRLKSGLDEKRNHKCCKFQNCCNNRNSPNAQSTLKSSYCGGLARDSIQSHNYGYRNPISSRNYCPPSQGSMYGCKSPQRHDCSSPRSPSRHDCSSPKSPPRHDCSTPRSVPKHDCSSPKSLLKSPKSNCSFPCRDSKPCKSESEILKHLKVSVTMDNDSEELSKRHKLDHVKKNIARYACKNKSSDPVKFLVEIEKEFDCKKPDLNECAEDMENVQESNSKNNLSDTDRFILKMIKQLIEFKKESLISRRRSETNLVNKSLSMSQLGKCLQDVQKDGSGLIITLRNAENEESIDKLNLNKKCKDSLFSNGLRNKIINCKERNKNVINDCDNTVPTNSTFGRDCFRICPTDQMTQTDCSFSRNNPKKIKRVSYENLPIGKNSTKKMEPRGCKCGQSCINIEECPETVKCKDKNLYSYISGIQPRSCESSTQRNSSFAPLSDTVKETNVSPYLSYCKNTELKGNQLNRELGERSTMICSKKNDILERFNKLESNIRSLYDMVSSISKNNKSMCKTSVETMTDDDTKLCSDSSSNLNTNSNVVASQESFWKEMTSLIDTINSSLNENGKNVNVSNENYFDQSGKSFIQVMNQTGSNPQNIKTQSIKGIVKKSSPNSNQEHIAIVTATSINVDIPKSKEEGNLFGNNGNQFYDAGAESSSVGLKKVCCSFNPTSSKECCCSCKNKTKQFPAETQISSIKSNKSFCIEDGGFSSNVRSPTDTNGISTYSNNQCFSIQNCEDLLPEEQIEYCDQLEYPKTFIDYPFNMTNSQIYTGFNDIEYLNSSNTPIYICEVPESNCSFILDEPSFKQNNLGNMNNLKNTNAIDSKLEDKTNYCESIEPLQGNIADAINNLSTLITELKDFMIDAQARCKKNEDESYEKFLSQISLPSNNIRDSLKLLQDVSNQRSSILSNLEQQNTSLETVQSFSNLLKNSNEDVLQYTTMDQPKEKEIVPKNDDNAVRSSINLNNRLAPDSLSHNRDKPFSTNNINERQFQVQECKISFATDFSTIYANQVIRFVTTKNFPTNDVRERFPMSELRNRNNSLAQPSFDNVNNLKSELNSNYPKGLSVSRHLNESTGEIFKHYEDRDSNLNYNLQMDLTFKPDNKNVHENGEPGNILSSTRNSKDTERSSAKAQNQSIRYSVGSDSDKKKSIYETNWSESKYPETNNQSGRDSDDLIQERKSISFDRWDKNVRNSIDIIKEKFKSNSEIKLMQKNSGIDMLKARHSLQDHCEDSSDNSLTTDEKACDGTNCECMAEIEERLTNVLNDENFQKKINPSVSKNDRDQILLRRATIQRTPSGNHITEHVFTEREFNSKDSRNSKFKFSNFFSK